MNTQQSLSPSAQKTWGSSVVVPSLYEPIADAIGARQSGHVGSAARSHHERMHSSQNMCEHSSAW